MAQLSALYFKGSVNYVLKLARERPSGANNAQEFAGVTGFNATLYGAALDPALNGVQADHVIERDDADSRLRKAEEGNLLVFDDVAGELRLATAQEVTDFAAEVAAFKSAVSRESAKKRMKGNTEEKVKNAYIKAIHAVYVQAKGIRDAVESASSLAALKTEVSALPAIPDWDIQQLTDWFENQID